MRRVMKKVMRKIMKKKSAQRAYRKGRRTSKGRESFLGRKGEMLVEHVVFIVLNLIFLSILIVFLANQSNNVGANEDFYAKQVALLASSAKDGMIMKLNMERALTIAQKHNVDFAKIMTFTDNYVRVQLDQKSGREYHYFSNVSISAYPQTDEHNEYTGIYILTVDEAGGSV